MWLLIGRHCTCLLSLKRLSKKLSYLLSCRIRTLPLFVILLPVVAFWFDLHCGKNHILAPVSGWICKRWWRELVICFFSGTGIISTFSSFVEEQRQTSHTTVVSMVVETNSSARLEVPLSSSSRMRKISGASCWVLKWKEASIDVDIFCCSARKKLDGSTGDVERFKKDILSYICTFIDFWQPPEKII